MRNKFTTPKGQDAVAVKIAKKVGGVFSMARFKKSSLFR